MCIKSLKNINTSGAGIGKEADLIHAKTRAILHTLVVILICTLQPNALKNALPYILTQVMCFKIPTYEDFFKQNLTLKFSCNIQDHKIEMLTNIFSYYIIMRMRQFTYIENQSTKKQNKTKKNYQNQ